MRVFGLRGRLLGLALVAFGFSACGGESPLPDAKPVQMFDAAVPTPDARVDAPTTTPDAPLDAMWDAPP